MAQSKEEKNRKERERYYKRKNADPEAFRLYEKNRRSKASKENKASYYYKNEYGITLQDYNKMFSEQEGKCAICKNHQIISGRRLCIDHNHKTGKVRKLLCHACNTALGSFREDPEIMSNAIQYIREHN